MARKLGRPRHRVAVPVAVAYTDPFGLCPPVDDDPCNLNTGDPNLDNLRMRQSLESAVKSSPADPSNPGLQREVGGWCSGSAECPKREGTAYSVNIRQAPSGSVLAYHSHPNEGRPLTGDAFRSALRGESYAVFRGLSDDDIANARRRPAPTYIFSPNTITRLTPNGRGGYDQNTFERWTSPQ